VLIVNPAAGARRGGALAREAARELRALGLAVEQRVSERPGHARELAAALEPEAWDAVGVVGGDGTLHEVVNGLLDLVLLRGAGRLRLLSLLLAVQRGRADAHPLLGRRLVTRFELTLEPDSPVVVDGETLRASRLLIEVAPAALRVLAP
jgi:diacylglycerol kinase family enzyme